MFIPPFGMLMGKIVAVDAIASSPFYLSLPLILLVVIGSAATSFNYAKWIGYMTVTQSNIENKKNELLGSTYKISLLGLLTVDVAISLGVALILNNFVLPITRNLYPTVISTPNFGVNLGFTSFPVIALWGGSLAVVMLGTLIAKTRGSALSPPYMGGANVPSNNETFRTTADSEVRVTLSGVFLDANINEPFYNRLTIILGVVVTISLFLVEVL